MKTPQPIPVGFRGWDPAKLRDSFQAFASMIHNQARKIIVSDGSHEEMIFFMPPNGKGHALPWIGEDRKDLAKWMRRRIRDHGIYGVVHVCEAWVRLAESGPDDHTLKQVINGEIRVSELRPQHRRDALTVTAQTRDGYAHTWIDEVLRDSVTCTVFFGETREFDDFEGRFSKLFG